MAYDDRALKASDDVCTQSCLIPYEAWTEIDPLEIGSPWASLEKGDEDWRLPLMNAKGNLWTFIKGSFFFIKLLNLSKCIGGGGGCCFIVVGGRLRGGETKDSLADSLFDEDGGAHSLLPIMGKDHSLSSILGLALVALVISLSHKGVPNKVTCP